MTRIRPLLAIVAVLAMTVLPLASGAETPQATDSGLPFPDPIDPQSWELPEWQSNDDYRPIPGVDWNDPDRQAVKPIRAAMIMADFADRPFVVTEDPGTDVFGVTSDWVSRVPGFEHLATDDPDEIVLANPFTPSAVEREDVGQFYADFVVNEPSELNSQHTVNEYWLEDSYGLIGVEATGFITDEPLPGKEHEYGIQGNASTRYCPQGDSCNRDFDTEVLQSTLVDTVTGQVFNAEDYDFRWLVHAGYGESGMWQEFGEMMFTGPEAVSDRFGPPTPHADEEWPNAAGTRYVDWTSWAAAEAIWSHAIPGVFSTQAESSGAAVFAHELSHIFGVLDNYNNPYGMPVRRSYTGQWAMLSRGAFNGPGGAHSRWQIPATQGASMGAHHMLRNKIRLGFTPPHEVLTLDSTALSQTGPVAADIFPRAYPLAPVTTDVGLHGIVINIGRDQSPSCSVAQDHTCDGDGYDNYTVEVVDQMGHDSFTSDHGVLIAKNKTGVDLAPFMWAIDAHPEDINTVTGVGEHEGREVYDFIRPETGERAAISLGDARQLADALFHAGTGEGVVSTYVDEHNGLQFYVLDTTHDADDPESTATYRVAVRSLDGHGPLDPATTLTGGTSTVAVNTGEVVTLDLATTNASPTTDISHLTVDASTGLEHRLDHAYVETSVIAGGATRLHLGATEPGTYTVTVTATSELTGATSSVDYVVTVLDPAVPGVAPGVAQ